jgi:hypothetical protein
MRGFLHRLLSGRRRARVPVNRTVSVAIPVYGDPRIALKAAARLARDRRVGLVVMNDDASRHRHAERLAAGAARLGGKVRFYRNAENLGAFANKLATLALCPPGFVLLLDSDNIAGKDYLDALFEDPRWDPGTIYCPEFAEPAFDFRRISGKVIDFERARLTLSGAKIRWFRALLNTGNFVVDRDRYVACAQPYRDIAVAAADVIAFNYLWLRAGGRLKVVRGMRYRHRRHENSFFARTASVSTELAHDVARAFLCEADYEFPRYGSRFAADPEQPRTLQMLPEPT